MFAVGVHGSRRTCGVQEMPHFSKPARSGAPSFGLVRSYLTLEFGGLPGKVSSMGTPETFTIDEYLRKRLLPVEGVIPRLPGIDMYGNSIPAGAVGGDLFEYINFQQRYNIDARIARAFKLAS